MILYAISMRCFSLNWSFKYINWASIFQSPLNSKQCRQMHIFFILILYVLSSSSTVSYYYHHLHHLGLMSDGRNRHTLQPSSTFQCRVKWRWQRYISHNCYDDNCLHCSRGGYRCARYCDSVFVFFGALIFFFLVNVFLYVGFVFQCFKLWLVNGIQISLYILNSLM